MGFIMNIAYVNGEYVPIEDAKVSVRDRGLMFSDGVYEVAAIINGKLIDNFEHLKRLERSLSAIKLLSPVPVSEIPELVEVTQQLTEEERKVNGKNFYRNVKKVETGPSDHEKKEKNKKVNDRDKWRKERRVKYKKPQSRGDQGVNRRRK